MAGLVGARGIPPALILSQMEEQQLLVHLSLVLSMLDQLNFWWEIPSSLLLEHRLTTSLGKARETLLC